MFEGIKNEVERQKEICRFLEIIEEEKESNIEIITFFENEDTPCSCGNTSFMTVKGYRCASNVCLYCGKEEGYNTYY